jgi:hypothetical protein
VPRKKKKTATSQLAPNKRETYGVTVTVTDGHRFRSFHRVGYVGAALKEIAEAIDAMDGEWLVISASTPNTIHSDLDRGNQDWSDTPESIFFSRIHRRDLVHPKLLGGRAMETRR